MKRFMGMMPSNEITVDKKFKDDDGLLIRINAGPHGWTIIYADGSTKYADNDASSEENYNAAYNTATDDLGELTEIERVAVMREVCNRE